MWYDAIQHVLYCQIEINYNVLCHVCILYHSNVKAFKYKRLRPCDLFKMSKWWHKVHLEIRAWDIIPHGIQTYHFKVIEMWVPPVLLLKQNFMLLFQIGVGSRFAIIQVCGKFWLFSSLCSINWITVRSFDFVGTTFCGLMMMDIFIYTWFCGFSNYMHNY